MTKDINYVLSVGKEFEGRLLRLNDFCNPHSFQFLKNNGLKERDHVIDVGCGIGELTCWLAEQVGPEGHVTAIDISSEQLELAQSRANLRRLSNIEFIELSVYDLMKLNRNFDLVYSRLVLDHLIDPQRALQEIIAIVKPNGTLCFESNAFSAKTSFCYPENAAHTKHWDWYLNLRRTSAYHVDFGIKLPQVLKQFGLTEVKLELAQAMLNTQYQREHCIFVTEECAKAYQKHNIATANEIAELITELRQTVLNADIQMAFYLMAQVSARNVNRP